MSRFPVDAPRHPRRREPATGTVPRLRAEHVPSAATRRRRSEQARLSHPRSSPGATKKKTKEHKRIFTTENTETTEKNKKESNHGEHWGGDSPPSRLSVNHIRFHQYTYYTRERYSNEFPVDRKCEHPISLQINDIRRTKEGGNSVCPNFQKQIFPH